MSGVWDPRDAVITITVAVIGLAGTLAVAGITYWTTKRREREAEWRKEKLAHYGAFIESLSGIVAEDSTLEGQREFARASNNLLLFAPQGVIEALDAFRREIRLSNPERSRESHDRLLAALLLAIRQDVGVSPADDSVTFAPRLWASGVESKEAND